MKKVLFVATVTNHIIAFHIPYLKWFKQNGYEVHVASNGDEKIDYCDKHYNLPFERLPWKKNNYVVYKELKKIITENDYEIIHCHTPVGGVLTRLAARKIRKNDTKIIYTAHGFHFYKGAPLLNWIIYYPIEKICARWTDCLITITKEDYEIAKKNFKAKQIEYVHGVGMNAERLKRELTESEKKEIRKQLNIKNDDIVFTYVAELNKNKNQSMLINAIRDLKKQIKNLKLLLVGTGSLYEEYKKIIKDNDLYENVKLLGKRTDINEILSITDIYLASSIREGLPVNVIEAMYKGLPIIAKNNRGHRELIINKENGFIIENEKEMKSRIIELLSDRNKFKEKNVYLKNKSFYYEPYLLNNVEKEMEKIYLE